MKLPKLILTDIDGVWTDSGMYYSDDGSEFKKFNASDGAGVLFCKLKNIPVGIITGEDTEIVSRRAKKLKIDIVHLGVEDKLSVASKICSDLGITLDETAYIGDDLNDISLLQAVGISAAPANAPDYIKAQVGFVTNSKGGDGAFREFVETIFRECGVMDELLRQFIK